MVGGVELGAMRVLSLFSGIGAHDKGLQDAGMTIICQGNNESKGASMKQAAFWIFVIWALGTVGHWDYLTAVGGNYVQGF